MDSSSDGEFGFLFNDINFSDRVLRIEVMDSSDGECKSGSEGVTINKDGGTKSDNSEGVTCISPCEWARNPKRRKIDTMKAKGYSLDHSLNMDVNGVPDFDAIALGSQDEETILPQLHSGDEAVPNNDLSRSMGYPTVLRVKTVHVSSAILAAKSPFFYKLFSNGMRESGQHSVTLRIKASQEAALMDLLKFMYSNTLSVTTAAGLLDVLMDADKFEVLSCMRYCSRLLQNLPLTPDSALLYLELPSSVLKADIVQPLVDAAKQYFASRYKDLTEFSVELLNLPMAGIEAVLSRDDLQVVSEDAVYDFVLKWAKFRYSEIEDRRKVLGSWLGHLIRFPQMTCQKLEQVLTCNDFDHDYGSKVALEAFRFKAEAPYRQEILAAKEPAVVTRYVERAYKHRPVKVIEFKLPRQQCLVYLDLKRDDCENLFLSGRVRSQAFYLGRQGFYLRALRKMDQLGSSPCFGLFLGMQESGLGTSAAVNYSFAARSKPSEEFLHIIGGYYTFTGENMHGSRNLFRMPWNDFMADDSPYFINGILHLRADLTIKN